MMTGGLLSLLRIAARPKTCAAIVVTGIFISAGAAYAKCADDDTWCIIKEMGGRASTVGGIIAKAKTGFDIAKAIGIALGLISEPDRFKEVEGVIQRGFNVDSWQKIELKVGEAERKAEDVIDYVQDSRKGLRVLTINDDELSNSAVKDLMNEEIEKVVFSFPRQPWQHGYSINDLDSPPGRPDLVYDWRLGIPALLKVISYRIVFLAAYKPNFRSDGYRYDQLMEYRAKLIEHYDKMLRGVRCASDITYPQDNVIDLAQWVETDWCIDIHTGLGTSTGRFQYVDNCHTDSSWDMEGAKIAMEQICTQPIQKHSLELWDDVQADLKRELIGLMPLYEVRVMIDLLYLLANPIYDFDVAQKNPLGGHPMLDFTEKYQRIPSYAAPSLCLEARGAGNGAEVQLSTCNRSLLQHWEYDRPSGKISNPFIGKCLEISRGAAASAQRFSVSISDCSGDDWQKWTYDPETQVLLNAMGTVLNIDPDPALTIYESRFWFRPGDPVLSKALVPPKFYLDTTYPTQAWLAEQLPRKFVPGPSFPGN
jgi:hypothetical protein